MKRPKQVDFFNRILPRIREFSGRVLKKSLLLTKNLRNQIRIRQVCI